MNDNIGSENEDMQSGISVAEKQDGKPDDARQLKRARSNAKGILSKRQNNIIELILATNNWPELGKRFMDLQALQEFQLPHKTFDSTLGDEDDIF